MKNKSLRLFIATLVICFTLWTINWLIAAYFVQKTITQSINELKNTPTITAHTLSSPKISGYPHYIKIEFSPQRIETITEHISIEKITAQSLPFIGMPIQIKSKKITTRQPHWKTDIVIEEINARVRYWKQKLYIENAKITSNQSIIHAEGIIDYAHLYPQIALNIKLENITSVLGNLTQGNIIKPKPAIFIGAALRSLEKNGYIHTKITSQDNKLYLGPIKIFEFPKRRAAKLALDL